MRAARSQSVALAHERPLTNERQGDLVSPGLAGIRDRIDALDSELVELLAARLALVASASRHKRDQASVSDPSRVAEVLERVRVRAGECGAPPSVVETIYRTVIDEGIGLEQAAYDELTSPAPILTTASASRDSRESLAHLRHVMSTMRAMRRLDGRPVPSAVLTRLVEAASWAPVGGSLGSSYRFVVVTSRSQIERLAPRWSEAMEFYLGALAPRRSPAEARRFERVRAAMRYQAEHFARVPALIVVCLEPVSFSRRLLARRGALRELMALSPADRLRVVGNLGRWARRASAASAYPATENLLLAARAHGLGATLTTWHSAFEQDFKAILGIPRAVDIYAIVPVGYPLGKFGPVRRPPAEALIEHDRWRGAP